MNLTEFWTICSANGIILEKEDLDNIERFATELIKWNKKVNLVSRRDVSAILEKHILHSIAPLKYCDLKGNEKCVDMGTGGGLPGIPLKIVAPKLKMYLVDSKAKKAKITEMLAKHTGLNEIYVVRARVEEMAKEKKYRGKFDVAFARAVGNLASLASWSKELLNKDGKLIALKGGELEEEITKTKRQFPKVEIEVEDIDFLGAERFRKNEKKIVICRNIG